ncbi:hypothetical protein RRG08_012868 [Elysia crispata]|uniref:Uncharacterized protein n=1 Tax=Elysia crispata TaxID=231223 RepID=A0AAE1ASK2_9GAST|nr:hypothetical protein RRG08_012868 [Elysia crispata]
MKEAGEGICRQSQSHSTVTRYYTSIYDSRGLRSMGYDLGGLRSMGTSNDPYYDLRDVQHTKLTRAFIKA